jgi:hypothetical protein
LSSTATVYTLPCPVGYVFKHFTEVIEPRLNGLDPKPILTLAELVDLYLERHAAVVRSRTIGILRERLAYATRDYGAVCPSPSSSA